MSEVEQGGETPREIDDSGPAVDVQERLTGDSDAVLGEATETCLHNVGRGRKRMKHTDRWIPSKETRYEYDGDEGGGYNMAMKEEEIEAMGVEIKDLMHRMQPERYTGYSPHGDIGANEFIHQAAGSERCVDYTYAQMITDHKWEIISMMERAREPRCGSQDMWEPEYVGWMDGGSLIEDGGSGMETEHQS